MSNNIQLKKKVTIKRKVTNTSDASSNGIWKKLICGVVIIAVLGGVIYGVCSMLHNSHESLSDDNFVVVNSDTISQPAGEIMIVDDSQSEDIAEESEDMPLVENEQPTQQEETTIVLQDDTHRGESISGTLEEKAKRAIRGDFGNGQIRKDRLGDEYAEIQNKVNEMYRNGMLDF